MTYHCSSCDTDWSPHMCDNGACPVCRTGTKRGNSPLSEHAEGRYRAAVAERVDELRSISNHVRFDAYYAERETARMARDPRDAA